MGGGHKDAFANRVCGNGTWSAKATAFLSALSVRMVLTEPHKVMYCQRQSVIPPSPSRLFFARWCYLHHKNISWLHVEQNASQGL